jgi:hypothetical protein
MINPLSKCVATLAFALSAAVASTAGAAIWTPAEISTVAWYDAADASTITTGGPNGYVTDWLDKSGNGVHLTQGNDGDRPDVVAAAMNGLNVLEFAGRTEDMDSISNVEFKWAAIVVQYNGTPGFAQALGSQTGAGGDNYTIQYRGDINSDRWQNAYFTNGNPTSVNGASAMLGAPAVVIHTPVNLTNFPLQVGGDRGISNRGWDGYIAEVILGNQVMDTELRQTVEGYLAHKWGFEDSLVDGHPYAEAAPVSEIPEPASLAMGLAGLTLLAARRRR